MFRRSPVHIAILMALVPSFAFGAPIAAAQPRVLVRAESRIELRTRRIAAAVVVEGALRDDLGQPLPDRELTLRWRPLSSLAGSEQRHALRTDEDGSFRVELSVSSGNYQLNASFAGDRMHERVEVARQLDLDRADVRLRVDVPRGGRLDLDVPSYDIVVRAQSDVGGGGVRIEILDELDRMLASGITDAAGSAELEVPSSELGTPGAGRLKVRSAADARRAEAQTEVPVIRFRNTTVTLASDQTAVEAGAPVRFWGTLTDSRGPIGGRAVGLFAADRHLGTTLTDAQGLFDRSIELGVDEGVVEVVARFESDAPGRTASESDPLTIRVASGGATSPWAWLLLPTGICILLLVLIARRTPPPPERATAAPPPPTGVSAGARVGRRPERTDVGGRVVSHDAAEPIAGARATLRGPGGDIERVVGADGRFAFEPNEPGSYTLLVAAPGYAEAGAVLSLPHRGEWTNTTVRLESMRARALAPFRRVAIRFLRSARAWPVRTNREVLDAARRGGSMPDALPELASEVEEACYGPEPPDDARVEAIDRLADHVSPPARRD